MILLLDLGNSRAKWALADQQGLWQASGASSYALLQNLVESLLYQWPQLQQVAIASVLKAEPPSVLGWLAQRCAVFYAQTETVEAGVTNGYANVAALGVDRWLVLLAARQRCTANVVVVDAGSAITLDYMHANGLHWGGWIIPGFMQQAREWALKLQIEPWPQAKIQAGPLGQDTTSCLTLGVQVLARAWLQQSHQQLGEAVWIFTGGDGEQLASYCDWPVQYLPNLVLEGLWLQWARSMDHRIPS